jgi:hypothetical protein
MIFVCHGDITIQSKFQLKIHIISMRNQSFLFLEILTGWSHLNGKQESLIKINKNKNSNWKNYSKNTVM